MDKEDYVSLEVAKLLKEKGFNEPCRVTYFEDDNNVHISIVFTRYNENLDDNSYSCPTLYEAHKWLRGKGINICVANAITVKKPVKWFYTIDLIDNCDGVFPMEYYPSYEEALNNGIGRALKLI